jgi:type I restriction enzyme, R subunit
VRCRISNQAAFFDCFAPEASEILSLLLQKYAADGELQLVAMRKHLPDVLKVQPNSNQGNVNEITGKFGGADQLRNAVNQLQTLMHAA